MRAQWRARGEVFESMIRCQTHRAFCSEGPSDRGGERAAVMLTLIQTAKLNDIDPQAWLADVLSRIADHKITDLAALLPLELAPPTPPRPRRLTLAAPRKVKFAPLSGSYSPSRKTGHAQRGSAGS